MTVREQSILQAAGNTLRAADREIPILGRIDEPLILILKHVLSCAECDALIGLARDRMRRARTGRTRAVGDVRTGRGTFLEENENEWVRAIELRLASLMGVPAAHAEPLQILHYRPGEEYRPHLDYFTADQVANNRISTMIMYLNDVEEGGETAFPELRFAVAPKKGNAVYFEYFYRDPRLNELTLHAGAPVAAGEKWIATQWMRRQRYREL
ncbi:2OG-Fe(II) oxygenase [Paenibacillus sp. GCM10023250]|uniref:2OG-Fe(II) oxygenase n=1 Tax=Paenibacillus sp. GCM10023250 TaxID=3252648 RepID=UPI00361F4133